ncbi:MAG: hypothetical protein J1F28_00525 [Oscillospiraceae bacterium]|nr:hypothetical protein [Oscillospiraceae bacterium]
MTFDLSGFVELGTWLFSIGKSIFESFVFDFGDFQINGFALMIGIAVFCIICYLLGRITE